MSEFVQAWTNSRVSWKLLDRVSDSWTLCAGLGCQYRTGCAGLDKGANEPGREVVGSVSHAQLREIAEAKMVDLNANDIEAAMKIIAGSARSMGLEVSG